MNVRMFKKGISVAWAALWSKPDARETFLKYKSWWQHLKDRKKMRHFLKVSAELRAKENDHLMGPLNG